MKSFSLASLHQAAKRRRAGYLQDVLANSTVEGDRVQMTEEAYIRLKEKYSKPLASGPGTELKALLKATLGIVATPNCSCNRRARTMDEKGCDWCEANLDTIVGWLREEATKRKLPFLDAAGRLLVRRAIKNARKSA